MAQDVGTGAAANVAAEVINKGIVAPLMQQIDDLIHLDRNSQFLQVNLERLKRLLQDISNDFENQRKRPADCIAHCLQRMGGAIQEAKLLIESQGEQRILGWFKISRQVREMNTKFDKLFQDLLTDFSMFLTAQNIVSAAPLKETDVLLQPMPEAGFVGWAVESAETQLQTWINAEAPQVRVICIHGMAGVGKTTLLTRVHNSYQQSKDFDVVIWVTVSQDYKNKISDLQGQIAKAVNLDLSDISNIDTRKMMLSADLKKKKFLLILDDVWSPVNLEKELGVAFGDDKLSKIVLSTRNRDLVPMKVDKFMEVKPLSKDQGWELFERLAFKGGHVPEKLKQCAREIADECAGLPLAITVVAAVMSDKTTEDQWTTSSTMMKTTDPSFPDTHPHVEESLYKQIILGYKDLVKSPNLQSCFLYCAMFPEDEQICVDELVRMWIAEGFCKSRDETYSMDMAIGYRYVKLLIDCGMFQSVNFEKQGMDIIVDKPVNVWKKRFIRVHDVIRDVAIYIGEKQKNYLCRAGLQLKVFPGSPPQDCKKMSLHRNQIASVPEDFPCTQLVILILSKNPLTRNVQGNFLNNLTSLRVLDLSNTQIESVPTSLTQLRYLDLSNTQIESVPTSFTKLEFLALRCTCIKELPKEIGNLSNLQFLDISECKYLTSLPTEISQLTSLKRLHLSMGVEKAVTDPTNVMALMGLKNVIELHLYMFFNFKNHEIMGTIMGSWVKMRHLYLHYNHIHLKCNLPEGMQNMKNLQSLVLYGYRGTQLPKWICEFQQLERLELDSWHNVEMLPALGSLPNLKFLKLSNHPTLKNLRIGDHGLENGFPKLEMLHLSKIPKLREIEMPHLSKILKLVEIGVLEEGILPHLHLLKVKKCPLLKKSLGGVERLPSLYGHTSWWGKIEWD
jgi:disease resistance protein RPS2